MKEKLKIAIGLIIVLVCLLIIMVEVIMSGKTKSDVLYKDLILLFEESNVCFEEEFHLEKKGYLAGVTLKLQFNNIKNMEIEVWLDGKKIERIGVAGVNEIHYRISDKGLYLGNIKNLLSGEHVAVVKYNINTSRVAKEYNNITAINIDYENTTMLKNIIIQMDKETKKFNISDNRLACEKTSNNTYMINAQEMRGNIIIAVDKGSILTINKIPEDYLYTKETKERKIQNTFKGVAIISLVIGVINIITVSLFTKHKRYEKEYYRDVDGIIDVTLAESIIDRKINSNNLIMSVIVDQISCGNIELDNDELIFEKYDNESEIKREITDMLFCYKDRVKVKELSKVLKNNINEILKKFRNIKKQTVENFYNSNIYDIGKEKILKLIRIISMIFIIAISIYVVYVLYGSKFTLMTMIIVCIIGIPAVIILKKSKTIHKIPIVGIPIIYFSIIFIGLIMVNLKPIAAYSVKPMEMLIISIGIIINIINIKVSKRHILTQKGIQEYRKVKGLRDYLVDYSLIKERDIQSVIIWDKYLVYATAFGIPSKVTKKFSEALMEMGETLDKINKLLINEDYYY